MEDKNDLVVQDPVYSEYVEVQKMMNTITSEMKEIPILPSENPGDDVHRLTKVEFPEQGGVLTYMDNQLYPYKGFPHFEFVDKIDIIKKISKSLQSGFYHNLKNKNKLFLILSLPFLIPVARDIISSYAYTFFRLVERFRIKKGRYSDAVRELDRACSLDQKNEDPKIKELRLMIKDVECMIVEFDNAYRFRLQDVFAEVNKDNLKKNPVKEINRLLNILSDRELLQEQKDKWKLLRLFTSWYLRFDRKFLRMIQNVLLEIDVNKFELTKEDKAFCIPRKDYIFGFIKNPETDFDMLLIERQKVSRKYQDQVKQLRSESTKEHSDLYKKQQNIADKLEISDINKLNQINKDYLEGEKQLNQEYNDNFKKLQEVYSVKKQNLLNQHRNRHPLGVEQNKQREELDKKYNSSLQELENIYKLKLSNIDNKIRSL